MSIQLRVARSGGTALLVALVLAWVWKAPFSTLGTADLALSYSLIAVSLVLLTGWVGQISLAQASFVGIGAFVTGVVVRSWHVPFPLTLPIAAAVAGGTAALFGMVALRVRGLYLAVATLIFAWMTQAYLFNQPWLAGAGGSSSATTKPLGTKGSFPYIDFTDRKTFYYVALAALVAAVIAAANLRDSKTGRAWFAVKGSEIAAASLGIPVTRYKLLAFATSGALAGIAGNLIMTHDQVVTSTTFGPSVSLFYLAIAVVGGLSSLPGAVASGILFAALEEVFFRVDALAGLLEIVSACLLAGVLLFFPGGLAALPKKGADRVRRIADHPATRAVGRRVVDVVRGLRSKLAEARRGPHAPSTSVIEPETGTEPLEMLTAPADGEPAAATSGSVPSALRRIGSAVIGRLSLGSRQPSAPDALSPTLALAEVQDEVDQVAAAVNVVAAPPAVVYVPGTATKLELPARDDRKAILAARDITVKFGGLTAVDNAQVEVREGEIVGLIGPNGAGKTTLFNAISGLNEPTSGTVHLFGEDVTSLPVHERAQRGMGRTFQMIQLFPQLSVFENLLVATHTRNATGFLSHLTASSRAVEEEGDARRRVRHVVALLGLEEVADRPVAGLPFGVLRMVEMARALVTGAPFVMLDEPASGLDNTETDRLADLLLWVRQSLGISLLLIEHDVRMVTSLCDYIYVIERGRPIADGTAADIQRHPAVIAAYLGQADEEAAVPVEVA